MGLLHRQSLASFIHFSVSIVVALALTGCSLFGDAEEELGIPTPAPTIAEAPNNAGNGQNEAGLNPGVSFPLGCSDWHGPRLTVDVAPGRASPQKLVLDTGSSTLAFCKRDILQEVSHSNTPYFSCNQYNPGGTSTGYWGPFVKGPLRIGNQFDVDSSVYAVMQQEESMPCTNGLEGIFGIAFRQLDLAFSDQEQPFWQEGSAGKCPTTPAGDIVQPLMRGLKSSGGVEKVGIYWSGQQGDNVGTLYLDEAATSNEHYVSSSVQGPATLGELGWYDISVQSISVGSEFSVSVQCNPRSSGENCIIDTGTPAFVVPSTVFDEVQRLAQIGESTTLTFWLAGEAGNAIPVSFDTLTLSNIGALSRGTSKDGFILGLPLFMFYYTVFDISSRSVSFVPLPGTRSTPTAVPDDNTVPGGNDIGPWQPGQPGTQPWPDQPFPGPWGNIVPIPGASPDTAPWRVWDIGYDENGTAATGNNLSTVENGAKAQDVDGGRRMQSSSSPGFQV